MCNYTCAESGSHHNEGNQHLKQPIHPCPHVRGHIVLCTGRPYIQGIDTQKAAGKPIDNHKRIRKKQENHIQGFINRIDTDSNPVAFLRRKKAVIYFIGFFSTTALNAYHHFFKSYICFLYPSTTNYEVMYVEFDVNDVNNLEY